MNILYISCCLDPRFLLKYCTDDEVIATHQIIIQQGIVIARRMEGQQPPCPSAGGENKRQKESTDVSTAPAKKRRLADILSTTNSPQEAMSIEEHVKEELSCYLELNQPEINSTPLECQKCHNKDLCYISILAQKYLSVCAASCTSEQVFRTSGNIVTGKHSCLKPDKID